MTIPYVIAEAAQGYEGSADLVRLLVKAAAGAGADAVKFQVFFADELALPDYRHYDLFTRLELDEEVWREAAALAHLAGLALLSDVFGKASLEMLERAGADGYKIHTTDIDNVPLLEAAAATGKRIFLSCGGAEAEELDRAVSILGSGELTLLYGFQAEPTEPEDIDLSRLSFLAERYVRPVGFMDHTAGGTPLAYGLPFVALGLGASVIEKHLTLSRVAELEDSVSAMTAEEFGPWAADLRRAAASVGPGGWRLTDAEREYRAKVRRAVTAARDIAAGAVVAPDDLSRRRSDMAGVLVDPSAVVGRRAARGIAAGAALTEEDLA